MFMWRSWNSTPLLLLMSSLWPFDACFNFSFFVPWHLTAISTVMNVWAIPKTKKFLAVYLGALKLKTYVFRTWGSDNNVCRLRLRLRFWSFIFVSFLVFVLLYLFKLQLYLFYLLSIKVYKRYFDLFYATIRTRIIKLIWKCLQVKFFPKIFVPNQF